MIPTQKQFSLKRGASRKQFPISSVKSLAVALFLGASTLCQAQTGFTNGLVLFYPLNGNANDVSGNNRNGAATGVASGTDRFGATGGSLFFNGNSKIEVNVGSLPLTNLTLSVWMKPTADGRHGSRYVLHRSSPGTGNGSSQWNISWNKDTVPGYNRICTRLVLDGNAESDLTTGELATNNWYQAVVTFDGAVQRLFVNGSLIATNSRPGMVPRYVNDNFVVGMAPEFGTATGFIGFLDDVRIFNRALSVAEVGELYLFDAPFQVNSRKAIRPVLEGVVAGQSYQLQVTTDPSLWTNWGNSFIATNSTHIYSEAFDVDIWDKLFFRARTAP